MTRRFISFHAEDAFFFVNLNDLSRVSVNGDTAQVFLRSGGTITVACQLGVESLMKQMNEIITEKNNGGEETE